MLKLLKTIFISLNLVISLQIYAVPDDFNQQVIFLADHIHFDRQAQRFSAQGNIKIQQGTLQIKAQQAKGTLKAGVPDHVELLGNPVSFEQQIKANEKLTTATAKQVLYQAGKDEIRLVGNAKIVRPDSMIEGTQIRYGLGQGDIEIQGKNTQQIKITIPPQKVNLTPLDQVNIKEKF